jgi:glyceraldehyde-3-phosphate dehydrogenase (NADP+)
MVSLLLAEVVQESGVTPGALQVIPCLGSELGQLLESKDIKLISFTGSPVVGWSIKEKSRKKRIVLELGGNAGVIVDADADLDLALKRIVAGSYGNAGQSCIAVQRIYVQRIIYADFERRFVQATKEVPVGDPFDDKTVVGPMITEEAARKVEEWIREAVASGARKLTGGEREGAMLPPTILTNVRPDMQVCANEVFAPVVTLEMYETFHDAVARVNDSAFGLQAGVFTNSLAHAMYAFEELQVGGVMINDASTYRIDHMPYGGVKDSGFGREGIRYAIEEMTELKLLGLNLVSPGF